MTISTYIETTHTYSGSKPANTGDALQQAVKLAVSKGANAIINVRISPIIKYVKSISYIDGYSISGIAIKK